MATIDFEKKYQKQIEGIAKRQGVDTSTGKSMFISNLQGKSNYAGGGELDFTVAKQDLDNYLNSANAVTPSTVRSASKPRSSYDPTSDIERMYQKSRAAQLQALRDKAKKETANLNVMKQQTAQDFYNTRNATDARNLQNIQRLKEAMANAGILPSGENVTANIAANTDRMNSLNALDTEERRIQGDFDRRIADLNDPSREQQLLSALEAEKIAKLIDAKRYMDQMSYQRERDAIGDERWREQFDYQKARDAIGDQRWQKQFDEDVRRFGLNYALQMANARGYFEDGTPTFAREQFGAEMDYRNRSLAQQAAEAAALNAYRQQQAQATQAQKEAQAKAAQATSNAISQALTYKTYDEAVGALQQYAPQMQANGVDLEAVLDAINKRFGSPTRDPLATYLGR